MSVVYSTLLVTEHRSLMSVRHAGDSNESPGTERDRYGGSRMSQLPAVWRYDTQLRAAYDRGGILRAAKS